MISVIVPVYNVENYIKQCIDSILGQSYSDLEILLINDGSTDLSGEICDKYALKDRRIRVIHQRNQGVSAARNRGLKEAKGEWISFVDSDDWIDGEMYQKMMQCVDEYDADMILCKYVEATEQRPIVKTQVSSVHCFRGDELIKAYIQQDNKYLITKSVWDRLYRKDILKDLVFPEGMVGEEICFSVQAMCNSRKAVYLDEQLYNYRIDRNDSISASFYTIKRIEDEIFLTEQAIQYLKMQGLEDMAKELFVNFYLELSGIYIHEHNKEINLYIKEYRKKVKPNIVKIIKKNNMRLKKRSYLIIDYISPKLRDGMIRIYMGVKKIKNGN